MPQYGRQFGGSVYSDYFTTTKAAEYLSVHPHTIRNWCKSGKLSFIAVPQGRIFTRAMLDARAEKRKELESSGRRDDRVLSSS